MLPHKFLVSCKHSGVKRAGDFSLMLMWEIRRRKILQLGIWKEKREVRIGRRELPSEDVFNFGILFTIFLPFTADESVGSGGGEG